MDEGKSVTLSDTAWQQIVNLLDQERNIVKAMDIESGPLASTLQFMKDGILAGMTETIDSICRQAGVVPGQKAG